MKKVTLMLLVATMSLSLFGKEIKHRFLISNFMGKSLHYIDQFDSSKTWEIKLGQIVMDMQLIGDNQLMVNHNNGYDIYDLKTQKKVKRFSSKKINSIKSMSRLSDGRTFFSGQ